MAGVYSTVWDKDPDFRRRVQVIDRRGHSALSFQMAILRLGADDVLIVNGAMGFPALWRDLRSACMARLARRRFGVVVSDATWQPRSVPEESNAGILYAVNDVLSRLLIWGLGQRRTVVCLLSTAEVEQFLADTHWRKSSAVFTPFMTSVPDALLADLDAAFDSGSGEIDGASGDQEPYVFTGGNTLRDWDLLCDALADCGARVRVATRHTARSWPANFDVGPCSNDEFHRLASAASAGVLALRTDRVRSAGQQTYLNFLRLGTAVVVNDASGVRDHLDEVPGAFVTPARDAEEMGRRVRWLLDPANRKEVRRITEDGRRVVIDRYSPAAYYGRLADLAERFPV